MLVTTDCIVYMQLKNASSRRDASYPGDVTLMNREVPLFASLLLYSNLSKYHKI
jgi:hypothetical protein